MVVERLRNFVFTGAAVVMPTKDEDLLALMAEVTDEADAGLSLHPTARARIGSHMRSIAGDLPNFQRAIETLYSYGKVVRTLAESTGSELSQLCANEIIGLCKTYYAMLKKMRVTATQQRAADAMARFSAFCDSASARAVKRHPVGSMNSPIRLRIAALTEDA
jgi:hypothetical protein